MNVDMSVKPPTRQQKSAQQRKKRRENSIFLNAYYGDIEMTAEEVERGHRLELARIKKNKKQRERNRLKAPHMIEQQRLRRCEQKKILDAYRSGVEMTAKEKERGCKLDLARKKKNEKQREYNYQTAPGENKKKRKPDNLSLIVTDGYKGANKSAPNSNKPEKCFFTKDDDGHWREGENKVVASTKVKPLCRFEGCKNQIRSGGVCSKHGCKRMRTCSKEGCTKQAQSGGVCVDHGARTKHCSHARCTKQVVRGGKCKDHAGPVETFDGLCSIEECRNGGVLIKVNKILVCKRYPCMSHSGKGVRCSAKGCPKYVKPVQQGEMRQMMCVFHCDMAPNRCIHEGCVNDALQGGVCYCHGANTKLCCYDVRLFDESTKQWKASSCNKYARKGGFCSGHSAQVTLCSSRGCTNKCRNGDICNDCYLESLLGTR